MVEKEMTCSSPRLVWQISEEVQYRNSEIARNRSAGKKHLWRPPTDVYETETTIVVRVEIAGMEEDNFSICLEDQFLLISGVRPDVPERRAYHQMEIPFGEFSTEVDLPSPIVVDEIEAGYQDGFLRIVLPKARPKTVNVES